LKQAKARPDVVFGGLSCLLTGDGGQLPPVFATSLYDKKLQKKCIWMDIMFLNNLR
jgi:hypothetical protein